MNEEKKLTDEEIVKALEICINGYTNLDIHSCDTCPYKEIEPCGKAQMNDCLDLIHRLQDEIERLMERVFDCTAVIEYNEKCSKEIQACTILLERRNKEIAEQKAEIERLTEELAKEKEYYFEIQNSVAIQYTENVKLQKQVDELKNNKLKGEIIMKNVNELMNEIKEQCGDCEAWSGTDCTRNPYTQGCLKDKKQVIECHGMLKGCDMVQQAVKDTAKEILRTIKLNGILEYGGYVIHDSTIESIAERYGVEVE